MKVRTKSVAIILGAVMASSCAFCGLSGCTRYKPEYGSAELNALSDDLARALLGNDVFAWNVSSVSPEESFNFVAYGDPTFYSYTAVTQTDILGNVQLLNLYNRELKKFKLSSLNAADAVTYRTIESTLNTYLDYYKSKYATAFVLIGGDYISSDGGYVAEFASMCENYTFRNETDVENLLSIAVSVDDAFATYLDFAADRVKAGYPLYDYTVTAMQDYLNEVAAQGDDYYLYDVLESKIDGASFLDAADKLYYKVRYESALTNNFMTGVKALSEGLDEYKGRAPAADVGSLAAYGDAGRAYYEWCFKQKTGMISYSPLSAYDEMVKMYRDCATAIGEVKAEVAELEDTDKAAFDAYNEYLNGDRVLLDLTAPQEMLTYLKQAAVNIVPALKTEPTIEIKYMDETAGKISNALAYYVHSPIDESNSVEHITINPYASGSNNTPSDKLMTIAHEGYPGHLYAYVRSKEQGAKLLSTFSGSSAFSEGWAKYVEVAVLQNIADGAEDKATKLFCKYKVNEMIAGYLNMNLLDMQINYLGVGISDFVEAGEGEITEDEARDMVYTFMEIPAVYVPYGYGMCTMIKLHDNAKTALGEKYDEVEFNGRLLSEGFAPTLDRAKAIATEYIKSK